MAFSFFAWTTIALVVLTWVGYPLLLHVLVAVWGRRGTDMGTDVADGRPPSLTLLIAAHNEAAVLEQKLENSLALDYPADRLEILVASDGSSDRTVEIARLFASRDARVRVYDGAGAGKTATQNAAVALATGDIVVFTNADTMLQPDALAFMTSHFADESVGCVAARILWKDPTRSQTGAGTSFYWSFEQMLWSLESALGVLAWAPGACMAVRRSLFEPMNPDFGEDVVLPIQLAGRGARVVYEPRAVAIEQAHREAGAEFRVRTRMVLRSFAGTMAGLRELPWRSAWTVGLVVLVHKVFRWLTPYFLGLGLVASLGLAIVAGDLLSLSLLGAQLAIYAMATAGWLMDRVGLPAVPPLTWVYYFMLSVLASGLGVARAVRGERMGRFGPEIGEGLG